MQTVATLAGAVDLLNGSGVNGSSVNGSGVNGGRKKVKPQVVVVGTRTSLRTAVEQRLRRDFDVDPIRRGDDLVGSVEGADAVVVVDVARPFRLPMAYGNTLRAIASVLLRHRPRVVVCLTYGPGHPLRRRLYLTHCARAEDNLRDTGTPVVSLRPQLIVGTPASDGPNDGALFSGCRKYWARAPIALPMCGNQKVAPARVDDIVEVVARSVSEPPRGEGAIEEVVGPEQMTLKQLVQQLDERKPYVFYLPGSLLGLVCPSKRFLPGRSCRPSKEKPAVAGVPMKPVHEVWTLGAVRVRSRCSRGPVAFTTWYRLGAPMFLTALYVATLGIFALTIGFHDVFAATELGQRLASTLLVATGTLLVVAAGFLLFSRARTRFAIGFVSACVSAAFGAMLLGSAIESADPSRLVLWIAVTGCGILAALVLRNRAGPELATALRTGRLKFLTSIVSVGAIIGFGQWWYSTQYVPPSALPTVTVSTKTVPAGMTRDGRFFVMNGEIVITNQGDHPVNVVASQYEAIAARVAQRRPGQSGLIGGLAASPDDGDAEATSLAVARRRRMVEIGVPVPSESYMPPRDTRTQNFTFYVPADYDSVQLHAVVITSRRKLAFDRKVRSEPGGKRDLDLVSLDMPGTLRRPLDIDEPSWLRRLTRSERVLVVSRNTSPHGDTGDGCYFSPYLDASIERKSEWDKDRSAPACGKRNMRFERYYGLVSSEAASELDVRARPMSNTAATATSKKPGS